VPPPEPAGEAYSATQTPYLDLKGLTFKSRRGEGKRRKRMKEGRGNGVGGTSKYCGDRRP